jgi:DNA invertase Pin-like site-specific DNA recombinase
LCLVPDLLRRTKEASITTLLRATRTQIAMNRQKETLKNRWLHPPSLIAWLLTQSPR